MIVNVKGTDDNFELSISQVRTLCECLYNFKQHIQAMHSGDAYHNQRRILKEKQVEELFQMLEPLAQYKGGTFETALEKCINKKSNNTDVGEDALNLTNSKFYKK